MEARDRADRPQRQPKSDKYFDYEGGKRGSFFQFVKQLKEHFDGLGGSRPAMDESILRKKTENFSKRRLARRLLENDGEPPEKDEGIQRQLPECRKSEDWKKLQDTDEEMKQFLNGKLGVRRPASSN